MNPERLTAQYEDFKSTMVFDAETGHGRFEPLPDAYLLGRYYNGTFTRSEDAVSPATEFKPAIIDVMRGVVGHVRDVGRLPESFSFHDVGCGFGAGVWGMQQLGIDASGNEVNRSWIDAANPHCKGKLFFGSIEDIAPRLGRPIDVFFCAHVLEHLIKPLSAMKTMAECMSPRGLAYLCVPNAGSYRVARMGLEGAPYYSFPMHLHYFTPVSMVQMLRSVGLEPLQIETRPMDEPAEAPGDLAISERCRRLLGGELFVLAAKRSNGTAKRIHDVDRMISDWRTWFKSNVSAMKKPKS